MAPLVITARGPHDLRLPAYPAEARKKGEQGEVMVEVALDPYGSIRAARVVKSSGSTSLDSTALRSARTLRFRPPRPPQGVVLRHAIVVEIPFRFQLQ
jgi:protein TonB